MQGFLIYTTINFMETAYVHTLKTNANMMTTDFKGVIPIYRDWVIYDCRMRVGKLVSEHKQNTKPNHLSIKQNNKWFHPSLSLSIQF